MSKKVVYLELGQMLEIRLVGPQFETNYSGWLEQINPPKETLVFTGWSQVAFTDPKISVVPWPRD